MVAKLIVCPVSSNYWSWSKSKSLLPDKANDGLFKFDKI
jgi:hypothetical protein